MERGSLGKFHDVLKSKMDEYVHLAYQLTKDFPKEEIYGITSQLRRAAMSVVLNYIEGYARKRRLVKINSFETSYGSLQESKYLLKFCREVGWVKNASDREKAVALSEEISAMLWRTIEGLERES